MAHFPVGVVEPARMPHFLNQGKVADRLFREIDDDTLEGLIFGGSVRVMHGIRGKEDHFARLSPVDLIGNSVQAAALLQIIELVVGVIMGLHHIL